jgi:hypothetical protein
MQFTGLTFSTTCIFMEFTGFTEFTQNYRQNYRQITVKRIHQLVDVNNPRRVNAV